MRLRVLNAILVLVIAVLGVQKWKQYEAVRPERELQQRLADQLSESQSQSPKPVFAKEPLPTTPIEPQEIEGPKP